MVIGFTGATVADMAELNPEAIDLVNRHPDIFEVILRPFSHDIALLRSPAGFALNVKAGRDAIENEFRSVTPYYLPAEFMLTNAQLYHLERSGVRGTFVNAARFKDELRSRIPRRPYLVRAIFGSTLRCIPINGALSEAYLQSLHLWDVVAWNQTLAEMTEDIAFSWRDGESFLFVPDGIPRERAWLKGDSRDVCRSFLRDVEASLEFPDPPDTDARTYRSYPVHSFSDWIKEFRMLGFLDRLAVLEQRLDTFDATATALWLQAINSDVFSAVEKDSPVIALRTAPNGDREAARSAGPFSARSVDSRVRSFWRCWMPVPRPRADARAHRRPIWRSFGSGDATSRRRSGRSRQRGRAVTHADFSGPSQRHQWTLLTRSTFRSPTPGSTFAVCSIRPWDA